MRFLSMSLLAGSSIVASVQANSKSWAGTSSYFIQGMSSDAQDSYIQQLASDGAKVMRVWVNGFSQGDCQKGQKMAYSVNDLEKNSIGDWADNSSLDYLDQTLTKLGAHGMKALVSIYDANRLVPGSENGQDAYTQFGESFYTSSQPSSDFDNRINHILNYQGKYSGQVWKNYHSVIMGFDIANEPYQGYKSLCQAGTNDWLCNAAAVMRSTLGGENPIKIATGGIGGDYSNDCSFMKSAVQCPEVDIIAVHRYGGDDNSFTSLSQQFVQDAKNDGKLVIVEEFGVQQGWSDGFNAQADDITSAGVPWIYWEIVPAVDSGCSDGNDGFTLYYGSSDFDAQSAFTKASGTTGAQDWTGVIY